VLRSDQEEVRAQHEYVEAEEEMCSLKKAGKSTSSLLGICVTPVVENLDLPDIICWTLPC
jgi:hypothetical protein